MEVVASAFPVPKQHIDILGPSTALAAVVVYACTHTLSFDRKALKVGHNPRWSC